MTGAVTLRIMRGMKTHLTHLVAAAMFAGLLSGSAHGAGTGAVPALSGLLERVPQPPATLAEASRWLDAQGNLSHPPLVAVNVDIESRRQAMQQFRASLADSQRDQGARTVADLGQGMAAAGIDMARMQRDPAYAQQVQTRLAPMSPQALMAMSQTLARPMNQDPRRRNAAADIAAEAPAVQAAADAGQAYGQETPVRMASRDALRREIEAEVTRVRARPLTPRLAKPAMAWESIGCNPGCRAQWDAYAAEVFPLMAARETDVLRVRRTGLERWRAAVAADIRRGETHLRAARFGAASGSEVNQNHIVGYDEALVGELVQLIDRIADAVREAAHVERCGVKPILAPHAVCGF